MSIPRVFGCVVCAAVAVASPVSAQTASVSTRTVHAVRLTEPLKLDGRLDEPVYASVPSTSEFIQQEPHEGEPATEKTEAWVFFDDQNVYFALRCWVSEGQRIVANEMRRDDINIWWNDNVGISIDTFHDGRGGVFFQTNALGGVRDGAVSDERNVNYDYNSVWNVKSQRFDQGWTTELQIPFKSLRYTGDRDQVWGLILQRVLRGKNELSYLTRMPASYAGQALFKYSSAATLVGIQAPTGLRSLDVKPYIVTGVTTNRVATPAISNDATGDVGVDAKYGVTRGLTADLTYNTDFAQAEADDTQVNLTRFNLFFPEKREFFLEGQTIFAFGGVNAQAQGGPGETPVMFFSRRIGLDNGQAVPIRGGGRLTGRAGKYTVGLLNIETGDSSLAGTPATNFTVVRVKRDILRRSSIGVLGTARAPSGGTASQLEGLDAAMQFYQNVQVNGYYARTQKDGAPGDAESYLGQFRYAADRYGLEGTRLKVGGAFNPEVGFLKRQDFVRNYAFARFSPRPRNIPGVRKIGVEASVDNFESGAGALQTRLVLGTLRGNMENGDNWDLNYLHTEDVLAKPFQIASNVLLPVGDYNFGEARLNYQLGPQRQLTGTLTVAKGTFYSGDKTEAGYTGRIGVSSHLVLEPRLSLNWVDLPEGNFVARVISNRTTVAITPRMFLAALMQYNSSSSTFGANIRFRWEYTPGSDLFVVYTEGRDTRPIGETDLQSRGFTVKFTRLLRF